MGEIVSVSPPPTPSSLPVSIRISLPHLLTVPRLGTIAPGPDVDSPSGVISTCQQVSAVAQEVVVALVKGAVVEAGSRTRWHRAQVHSPVFSDESPSIPCYQSNHDCPPASSALCPHIYRLKVVPLPQAAPSFQPQFPAPPAHPRLTSLTPSSLCSVSCKRQFLGLSQIFREEKAGSGSHRSSV